MNGWGVFSTLRVCDGVLFAYERHYDRMARDAARMHVSFDIPAPDLEKALLRLIGANKAFDATLRVAVMRNKGGLFEAPQPARESDVIAFTAALTDWGEGVKLSYVPQGRHALSPFAGIKMTSWAQNLTWYEEAHEQGFDEVVLLNERGQVSECTSANIFIIQGNRVWTPPVKSSGCLAGVTRAILLEQIHVPGLTIGERELSPSDLEQSDQVFVTSTTRDLLPVLEIDHRPFAQNREILARLQKAFSEYRESYVAKRTAAKSEKRAKQAGISNRGVIPTRLQTKA
jgi:branched-chain amino acid aminotransferase